MDLYLLIVINIFNLWLGWRVLRNNTRSATNVLFFLFILITIAWSTANYISSSVFSSQSIFWIRFTMFFAVPQAVIFFFLVHTFPKSKLVLKKKYFYGLIFFAIITMIVALSPFLFTSVTIDDGKAITNPGPGMALFLLVAAGSVVAGLIKLIRKYRKASGIEKIQLRYVFLGLSLMFVLILTFNFVLVVFFKNLSFVTLAPLFTLPFLAAIFYAITRHRLMDIRFIIKKTTVYVSTIVAILVIGLILSWIEVNYFKEAISPGIWGPIILLIGVILFTPVKKLFEKTANKYFFTSLYNYQATLEKLAQELTHTIDLDQIINSIVGTIKDTMKLDRAGVLLFDEQTSNYQVKKTIGFTEANGISLVRSNFLTSYLSKNRRSILYQELESLQNNGEGKKSEIGKLKSNMKRIEASLCLPLLIKDRLIGIIVLGNKITKEAYTKEDIDLLTTLSNQASVAVENARLYQTEQQAKEILENFNKELKTKVNDQTKEIRDKNIHLEKLLKAQSEFLDIASHQLRTPVSLIKGITTMMLEGDMDKLPKEKKDEFLRAIVDKSGKLEIIINDILSASEFDSAKFSINPETPKIHIENIIDEAVKSAKMEAKQRNIDVVWKKPTSPLPEIFGESHYLEQALYNLISNALKYTPSTKMIKEARHQRETKGVVRVEASHDKDGVLVKVSDNGIGIPQKEVKKLFKKFARASNATSMYTDGSGLGLFIVKEVIEGHKGKVWVESEVGKGSTFFVRLPLA